MKKTSIIIIILILLLIGVISFIVIDKLIGNVELRNEGESCNADNLICNTGLHCIGTNLPDEGGCIKTSDFKCSLDSNCFTGYSCNNGVCKLI